MSGTSEPHNRVRGRFKSEVAKPRSHKKPKLGLAMLTAARTYRAALDASAAARCDLMVSALERCGKVDAALHSLNELATTFRLPPFTLEEVDEDSA